MPTMKVISYPTYDEELDGLYVINGRRVTPIKKGVIQSNDTIRLKPEPLDINEPGKKTKSDEGTYEEHYEVYEEYCIHRRQLVNQGLTMCDINQDTSMCNSCPYRKPRTMRVKVSSASTN
jgi:ectoine hydroxylase-related dioxygenase (phytanoyl-CoA dioxygenase family)